jgi:hypothetical protein
MVASCASLAGFSPEDLTDVRLLTHMAFHALADLGDGRIDISVSTDADAMRIEVSARRAGPRGWDAPDVRLLRSVTAVVAAEHEFAEGADRLVMRATVRGRGPATP